MIGPSQIYKTYLEEVLNMYPSLPETKAVRLPLATPYGNANGRYIAYLSPFPFVVGSPPAVAFNALSLTKTATGMSMVPDPTTLVWSGAAPYNFRFVIIKQSLPDSNLINCVLINLGENYSVDGDVVLDFTNIGFISFQSSNFI